MVNGRGAVRLNCEILGKVNSYFSQVIAILAVPQKDQNDRHTIDRSIGFIHQKSDRRKTATNWILIGRTFRHKANYRSLILDPVCATTSVIWELLVIHKFQHHQNALPPSRPSVHRLHSGQHHPLFCYLLLTAVQRTRYRSLCWLNDFLWLNLSN